jgi:uncharacterized membrane protein YbaN (DUF454 family)
VHSFGGFSQEKVPALHISILLCSFLGIVLPVLPLTSTHAFNFRKSSTAFSTISHIPRRLLVSITQFVRSSMISSTPMTPSVLFLWMKSKASSHRTGRRSCPCRANGWMIRARSIGGRWTKVVVLQTRSNSTLTWLGHWKLRQK